MLCARRTFTIGAGGKVGMHEDRPVFVAIASGGRFSGKQARQPDFLTPYLTTILATVELRDLTFFSVQGTGSGAAGVQETMVKTANAIKAHFASFRSEGASPESNGHLSFACA